MERKRYIRRKITYRKSYYEAWPEDVVYETEDALAVYQRKFKYVQFGVTNNLKRKFDEHHRRDPISWSAMRVKFRTDNPLYIKKLIDIISDNPAYINNQIYFPQTISMFDKRPTYYVYFMVGKRRKSKFVEETVEEYLSHQNHTIQERIGMTLLKLRKNKRMTQQTLSKRSHVNTHYISEIENGKTNASLAVIERLAFGIGIKLSDFFEYVENIE